jgi:hypothetical protein
MPQDPSQPQVASGYYPADGGYSAPEQYASISSEKIIPAGSIIELPYHRRNGKPIQLRIDEDVRESDLQADLDAQFPKTAKNIALEMLESPEKVSKEDFDFALQQSEAMQGARGLREKGDEGTLSKLADVLPHALNSLYEGALAAGQSGVMAINTQLTPRQQLNALGSIVEGGIRGTKQLADIGGMAFNLATGDKYGAYSALKDMQAEEEIYKRGGGTIPLDPWAAEQANKIKNVLDVTVLMPGVGSLLGNLGKEAAVQTIKDVAKQTSVGIGRKAAAFAASGIGNTGREILDAASKKFGESAGKLALAGGVTAGVQDDGGVLTGLGTALALYGAPTALKYGMSTLKWAGKIAGADAASEVIAQGLKDAAEKGVSEPMLRAVAKALPGDSAMRAFGQIADSSINGGLIGATIAGVQAAADPFNTGGDILEQAFIGGATGTAVGATVGTIPAAVEYSPAGRNRAFVREMARDIAGRPENRSFVVDGQEIPVADIQNRIKLLNNDGMSTTDKARIFAILKSAEFSGNDVVFIDNDTILPESLGYLGEFMGKGVRITPGYDGKRSTILVNVDQITPASAIEEVSHAFIGREAGRKIISDLIANRGGLSAALEPLIDLGQRYYDLQVQSNPQAAAKFGRDLAMAKDVNLPPEVRQQAAITLAEEWAANGIAEYLKNEDPTVLQVGRGNQNAIGNFIRKALFEINSGLNLKPTAPTYDPITGFYYKDGKLIDDPVLADISKKMKNAILFFDKNEGAYFPSDQSAAKAAGKPRAKAPTRSPAEQAGVQINDKLIDGTLITGTRPMARYEDTHAVDQKSGAKAGAETTKTGIKPRGKAKTELGKDDYHNIVFQQFAKITGEQALDPEANAIGLYFGNTSKVPAGTPIVYTRSLDNAQLEGLFNIQTHQGKPLIAPENRDAVARFNQAAKDGSIIVVDYDMNIGKETAGRKYAVSGQQVLLPLGIQQTQTGGPIAGVYNLSLLNDIINYQRLLPGMEKIDGALAQFGINTLADVVPLVRTHIENYSSAGALPGVNALMAAYPNVSKESATILRDLMHLSSNIQPRKSAPDVRKNEPFIGSLAELPRRKVEAYSVQGERSETVMARERSVSNDIRLDAIRNTQLYAGPDGLPVKVNVNLEQFVPKQRSNFSPSRSIPETIGDKQVITDPETGRRAFIQPNGRTKVYGNDGALMGVYEDFTEAQTKLNQADINEAIRLANSTARSAGAVGAKAITPQYVASTISPGESVLNFGAGKPDKATGKYLHSEIIRSFGGRVEEYDFGANAVGALDKKYNTVFASNVLNVQSTPQMLESTLSQIWDRVNNSGRAVFNYPSSPRYLQMSPKEVAASIERVTGLTPVRVGGTSSAPLWEVSKVADSQSNIRFSPRSPAAIARRAEEAKAMRARMEEEAPVRIMTEWLSAAGQAKQKEAPSERAEPQRAKGKVRPSIVEQAKVQAQSELLRRAESTAGYAQLSKGQKAQFLKDAAEARNGIAQKALERIAAQQQAKREAFQQEVEAFKTNTKAYLANKDVPFLDVEETRQVLRKKPSKRIEATPAQLEAIARLEVAPEFVRRDLGPTPKPTEPGTYTGFEALSSVGLPREDVPVKQTISPRVVNLLGTAPTKSMARILGELAKQAADRPDLLRTKPTESMARILAELAKKSAEMPKREPVRIDVTTSIPEPAVDIVTPIDEPRLPSNMIVTRTPKGNFQLYVVTTAGKLSAEGLYNNYRDTLQRAQTKYQKKYATR